jgi:outer membrane protein OmpA-like peptidoglycan-associated protein
MNKLSFTKLIMIMVLALCPMAFYGQNDNTENQNAQFNDYAYVTGDLGLGMLNGDNSGLKLGLNGHFGIGYQFDNIVGVKGNIGFGGLNGKYDYVNIDKSNYFEANANLTINLTDIIFGYNPDRKLNFVPHIGIGQVRYRVRLNDNNGNDVYENGYSKRDGRKVVATIPMGFELNCAITPSWKVYLDYTANYADTDLLDGIAKGEHNDWFTSINLGASYRLGSEANIFKRRGIYCNYWFVTADGGASFLFGDNKYNFKSVRGNANIGIGYNFHNFYRVYGKIGYGIFTGEYDKLFTLNYGDYYAANLNISADIISLIFGYDESRRGAIYPHIGLGQMQYRARATYANGEKAAVGYDHNASYNKKGRGLFDRKVALTIPVGVEFNYVLNHRVDLYADFTTAYADSDIVDAFWSGNSNDWHTTANVGLRYKFNRSCYDNSSEDGIVEDLTSPETYYITPEDVKQAVREALAEHAANQPKTETKTEVVEKHTIYHTNHANIVFPINEIEKINTQTNIDAINRASQEVQEGFHVEDIVVEGYASPEGPADNNYRLAEERAKAAAELVQNELHTHLDPSHVKIHSNGADWEGLIEAILGSDLADKEAIAKELETSSNREETLRKLMNKYSGIEPLLPQLRRANVTITTVKD